MIVWEELNPSGTIMRARAGYNKQGAYHSWDGRFYAAIDDLEDKTTWSVDFYDEYRDRETGELKILFSVEGEERCAITAQLAVEKAIYTAIANETACDYQTAVYQDEYEDHIANRIG